MRQEIKITVSVRGSDLTRKQETEVLKDLVDQVILGAEEAIDWDPGILYVENDVPVKYERKIKTERGEWKS